ncbi:hypothetical protein GCM10028857_18880 [Salinarchaeum chitinilyticum]
MFLFPDPGERFGEDVPLLELTFRELGDARIIDSGFKRKATIIFERSDWIRLVASFTG